MTRSTPSYDRAVQLFELLPRLRLWLGRRFTTATAEAHLSIRQYAALRGIREGARSAGELARRWQVTPAVLTGVIDRLERRGLVRREADPRDRRRLRLTVTPEGRAASQAVEGAITAELAMHLATESSAELEALRRGLGLLERVLDEEGQGAAPPVRPPARRPTSPRAPRRKPAPVG